MEVQPGSEGIPPTPPAIPLLRATTRSGGTIIWTRSKANEKQHQISIKNMEGTKETVINVTGTSKEVHALANNIFQSYQDRGENLQLDPTITMDIGAVCSQMFDDHKVNLMFQKCFDQNKQKLDSTQLGQLVSGVSWMNSFYENRCDGSQQEFENALEILTRHENVHTFPENNEVLRAWTVFHLFLKSEKAHNLSDEMKLKICELASQGVHLFNKAEEGIVKGKKTLPSEVEVATKHLSIHIKGTPLQAFRERADRAEASAHDYASTLQNYVSEYTGKRLDPIKAILQDVSRQLVLFEYETGFMDNDKKLEEILKTLAKADVLLKELESTHIGGSGTVDIRNMRRTFDKVKQGWDKVYHGALQSSERQKWTVPGELLSPPPLSGPPPSLPPPPPPPFKSGHRSNPYT